MEYKKNNLVLKQFLNLLETLCQFGKHEENSDSYQLPTGNEKTHLSIKFLMLCKYNFESPCAKCHLTKRGVVTGWWQTVMGCSSATQLGISEIQKAWKAWK